MTKVFGRPDVVAVYKNKLMSDDQKKVVNKLINEAHEAQQQECHEFEHYAQQVLIQETVESGNSMLKLGGTKRPQTHADNRLKLVEKSDSQFKNNTYAMKARKAQHERYQKALNGLQSFENLTNLRV